MEYISSEVWWLREARRISGEFSSECFHADLPGFRGSNWIWSRISLEPQELGDRSQLVPGVSHMNRCDWRMKNMTDWLEVDLGKLNDWRRLDLNMIGGGLGLCRYVRLHHLTLYARPCHPLARPIWRQLCERVEIARLSPDAVNTWLFRLSKLLPFTSSVVSSCVIYCRAFNAV